jgi:dephospho-CoA kinase
VREGSGFRVTECWPSVEVILYPCAAERCAFEGTADRLPRCADKRSNMNQRIFIASSPLNRWDSSTRMIAQTGGACYTDSFATLNQMKILGLLGGIASGKTVVARELEKLGSVVLDADRAGHEVLRLPHVKEAARKRWGASIFGQDGKIERKRLADIVFAHTDEGRRELAYLEKLTHPEIGRRLQEELNLLKQQGVQVAVLDAPVMLKAGWDRFCDQIWFIDAPRETRIERAKQRGWSDAEFTARELAQEPVERKRELADFVVDNSGAVAYTQQQIERLWHNLIA